MSIIGEFRCGEDILVALDAVSGDPDTVDAITAKLAPAETRGGAAVISEGAVRHAMTVTARPAAGDIPAGWTLLLPAATSATLAPGLYGIDARLVIGSGVDITDNTAFVRLTRPAL
jgi:hypothetical protein